mmetsp:Transcript_26558/g.64204  ORF Transcript_26558/g.64204 Transcript_26558/m.64204 type:complete len:93 (+) Transcript_26558:591-869(+)
MLGPFVAHFRQKVWQIGSFQSSMPGPTVFYHQDCLVISFRFNTTGRFDGATGTFGEILLKTLRKLTNIALHQEVDFKECAPPKNLLNFAPTL